MTLIPFIIWSKIKLGKILLLSSKTLGYKNYQINHNRSFCQSRDVYFSPSCAEIDGDPRC